MYLIFNTEIYYSVVDFAKFSTFPQPPPLLNNNTREATTFIYYALVVPRAVDGSGLAQMYIDP